MATVSWKTGVNGNWDDASRWDTGHKPGTNATVNVDAIGTYTLTVSAAETANSLLFNASGATLQEQAVGSLTLNDFNMDAGTAVLRSANTIGDFTQFGGQVQVFNAGSLGSNSDHLLGGEQTAMVSVTLGNALDLFEFGASTTVTIDAAAGKTLDIGGGGWAIDDTGLPTLQFGSASNTGTVVWHSAGDLTISGSGFFNIELAAGTLKAGDSQFTTLTNNAASVDMSSGATLDLAAFNTTIFDLTGAGTVTSTGGTLSLENATYFGQIEGGLALNIVGNVTLNGSSSYTGGTTLNDGTTLAITNSNALGSGGTLNLIGGELIATADATLSVNTTFTNTVTVAAATGKTLALSSSTMTWDGSSTPLNITFGDATNQGTIVLAPANQSLNTTNPVDVTVADGTLQLGSDAGGGISGLMSTITTVTVGGGATLDLNGFSFDPNIAVIDGTVTNSSATENEFQSYVNSTATGSITGNLDIFVVSGTMLLNGSNSYTGGTTIASGAELDLGNGGNGGTILAGSPIDVEGTLVDDHSSNEVLSGVISGGGTFTKNGTGATALSGANSYSGGTTLNSGTLIVTNSSSLGSGGITIAGGELQANSDATFAQDVSLSGDVALAAKTGKVLSFTPDTMGWDAGSAAVTVHFGDTVHQGTVILAPVNGSVDIANTIDVVLAGGTLEIATAAAATLLSNSATTSLTGGELLATADSTLLEDMTFTGITTVAAKTGKTLALSSGTMDWDASGAPVNMTFGDAAHKGTVVLDPTNESIDTTHPITVTVADGTVQIGSTSGSGLLSSSDSFTVAAGAKLDINAINFDPETATINGTVTNSSGNAAHFDIIGSGSITGAVTGNLDLEILGGVTTLTGTSSYTNGTTINAEAILDLGNNVTNGHILAGSAITDNGRLVDNNNGNDVLSGLISGSGGFFKEGGGTTKLSGTNNYSGGTTLDNGTLVVTNSSSLGTGQLTVRAGEILDSANTSLSVNSDFAGATGINETVAAAHGKTFTLASPTMTWEGNTETLLLVFGDAANDGTVVLDPANQVVNGAGAVTVTVADGTLRVGTTAGGALLSAVQSVTVDKGATLDVNGIALAPNSVNVAGTLTNSSATGTTFTSFADGTVSGAITGNLGVEVHNGTLTLSGTSSYTGGTFIDGAGTLALGNDGAGGAMVAGSAIIDNGTLIDDHSSNDVLSGVISGAGSFTKNGSGATTLSGNNNYSGGTTLNGGKLFITNASSLGSGPLALAGGELVAAANLTLSMNTSFSGTTGVAAGTGKTLTLASNLMAWGGGSPLAITFGDTAHTGTVVLDPFNTSVNAIPTVTVAGGTLTLGNTAAATQVSTATSVAIAAGAKLDVNGFAFDPHSAAISGTLTNSSATAATFVSAHSSTASGAITGNLGVEIHDGKLTLSGVSNYAGATAIDSNAELDLGNGGTGGSIRAGTGIADNGTLIDNHSIADTLSGAISGSGSFIKKGAGLTTLTGVNTYSGGTTVEAGATLSLGNGGTGGTLSAGSAIIDRGTLVDDHSAAETLSGIISGAGSLTKNGAGATTLSGANTYSGGTTLNTGELIIASAKSLGTGALTLNGGELLANASMLLNNSLHTGGTDTIAVAHGKTLTLGNTPIVMGAGKLVFGDAAGHDGTIVLRDRLSLDDPTHTTVEVKAGTVTQGVEDVLSAVLTNVAGTALDSGATIDAGGHGLGINGLTGAGTLTNSGASTNIFLEGTTNFAGSITGHANVNVSGNAALTGNERFIGALTIDGAFTVRLQGLFAEVVKFASGSGTLLLSLPGNFTGTIQGFQAGTTVDLRNIKSSGDRLHYDTATHILTVSDGSHSDQLHFAGSYVQGDFAVKDDGTGHVDLIFQTAPTSPAAITAPGSDQTVHDLTATDFGHHSHPAGDWIG
ncbi:MAG TPA: autotransporter-associated beta strand repeat-containing protein [Rhizomicrobium sp.]